jgi:hypothetical protein
LTDAREPGHADFCEAGLRQIDLFGGFSRICRQIRKHVAQLLPFFAPGCFDSVGRKQRAEVLLQAARERVDEAELYHFRSRFARWHAARVRALRLQRI